MAVLIACRGAAGRTTLQDECAPPSERRAGTATPSPGQYQLRLVATSGAKTGAAVEGTLMLHPQSKTLRHLTRLDGIRDTAVTLPLYGSADLNLAAVDAVSVGSITSVDPMQPGVLVVERRGGFGRAASPAIVIRLGSEANRRDRQRFDGGYMALRVREASPERIVGTWSSGVRMEQSAGYFCAVRQDGR